MYYIFVNKFFLEDCDANFIAEVYLVHVLGDFPDYVMNTWKGNLCLSYDYSKKNQNAHYNELKIISH